MHVLTFCYCFITFNVFCNQYKHNFLFIDILCARRYSFTKNYSLLSEETKIYKFTFIAGYMYVLACSIFKQINEYDYLLIIDSFDTFIPRTQIFYRLEVLRRVSMKFGVIIHYLPIQPRILFFTIFLDTYLHFNNSELYALQIKTIFIVFYGCFYV